MTNETDNLIRRFLLGELPDEQRLALEERLFKEDAFYGEVLAVQEELADDLVNGDLASAERAQVEDYFARSPRRQTRVEFATALSQALKEPQHRKIEQDRFWWASLSTLFRPRFAMVATALAVAFLIISGWLWIQNRGLSQNLERAKGEKDSLLQRSTISDDSAARKAKELEDQVAALKSETSDLKASIEQKEKDLETRRRVSSAPNSSAVSAFPAFILSPGLTRGNDEPEKLVISNSEKSLVLQLDLDHEGDYKAYVADIRTARGNLVWSKSGLPIRKTSYGRAISILVPSNALLNGEYEITLRGAKGSNLEAVGYYYFIILRR